MAYDDFDSIEPTSGIRVKPEELMGHLLLVWAVDYIAHSPTKFSRPDKPSDVIVVDVVDLDTVFEGECLVARRNWWRQAKLIQDLRPRIGRPAPCIAKMGEAPTGMSRNAYVLIDMSADEGCRKRAISWREAHPDFRPSEAFPQAGVPAANFSPTPAANQAPAQVAEPRPMSLLEKMAAQANTGVERLRNGPTTSTPPPYQQQPDKPPF